jgi:hypothetical protein
VNQREWPKKQSCGERIPSTSNIHGSLLVLTVLMASTSAAHTGFNNGGFESGNFSGWSTLGSSANPSVVTSFTPKFNVTRSPFAGTYFAVLSSEYTESSSNTLITPSAIESFLGMSSGSIAPLLQYGNQTPTVSNGVAIKQTVANINQGDKLSFRYFFETTDFLPYNDTAFVTINGVATKLSSVSVVGNYGDTGSYQGFEYTFTSSGNFSIGVAITSAIDSSVNSFVYLDNFNITSGNNTAVVPELSSLALLGLAGLAGGVYGWRRRRQAAA